MMRFIDLFAGLGGFHVGLKMLGHECVFACEKNEALAELYEKNFNIPVSRDIKDVSEENVPPHDILCAGFPCQPFSKAGKQKGLRDVRNGSFFVKDVVRILKYHRPRYFILENVPHLKRHNREKTWKIISGELTSIGYNIKDDFLSPHEFGIPQIRKRIFIVGSTESLDNFEFPKKLNGNSCDIRTIVEDKPNNPKKIGKRQIECLELWQEIIGSLPKNERLPAFPIWSMEFGATYPFEKKTPHACNAEELSKYKGSFGAEMRSAEKKEQYARLPSYAKTAQKKFPDWKIDFIRKNREFYTKHKNALDPFISRLSELPPSWQKLEWNCLDGKRKITNYLIQFRASGIRIKKTNYAPSLVLTTTQRPIIGWKKRYLTCKEAARLQSLESIGLPENETAAFRALGNAVNATIVSKIAENLIRD